MAVNLTNHKNNEHECASSKVCLQPKAGQHQAAPAAPLPTALYILGRFFILIKSDYLSAKFLGYAIPTQIKLSIQKLPQ